MKVFYYKGVEYLVDEIDIKRSIEAINNNKKEFDDYISTNTKLGAVKALKEYARLGLREAKQILELIWDNQISLTNIKEERQKKN
jgi:ribosomal protein L7/L12